MNLSDSNKESQDQYQKRAEVRSATQRLALGLILLLTGAFFVSMSNEVASVFLPYSDGMDRDFISLKSLLSILGTTSSITGIAALLMYYLRYGIQLPPRKEFIEEVLNARDNESSQIIKEKFEELSLRHASLLEKIESESFSLSEKEKQELMDKINLEITDETSRNILQSIEEKYSIEGVIKSQIEHLSLHYKNTTARLKYEINSLTRRGNLNLTIGSITAVLGLLILGSTVLNFISPIQAIAALASEQLHLNANNSDVVTNPNDYLNYIVKEFIPKFSLALLIEVFAYFFLRLYKTSLEEIKYFQNELTNIESKFVGLEGAILSQDNDLKKAAIESFVNTERNFILKKGESTVELEKSRIETSNLSVGLKSVADILKAAKN